MINSTNTSICEPESIIHFGTHSTLAKFTLVLAGIDGLLIILSALFLVRHRKHPAIIASSLELCFAILFGAAVGVAQMTLVGLPIRFTLIHCQIRFLLGALCWSLILTAGSLKAIRIARMKSGPFAYGTSSCSIITQFCIAGTLLVGVIAIFIVWFSPEEMLKVPTWTQSFNTSNGLAANIRICIEVCDVTHPLWYAMPKCLALLLGICALALTFRVRSFPNNFHDAFALFALVSFLLVLLFGFMPITLMLPPHLEFYRYDEHLYHCTECKIKLDFFDTFVVMLTQFLVVLSTTLLTVYHKIYSVLKHRARGPAVGTHLVAVVATASKSSIPQRPSSLRQAPHPTANSENGSGSLVLSTNLRAINGES